MSDSRFTRCANCDTRIDRNSWHPVTVGDDDVFSFCDEDCRDEWTAE